MNLKYIISLLASAFGAAFITFATQIILARNLSVTEFGLLSSDLTLISIVASFAVFGADGAILKMMGLYGNNGSHYVRKLSRYALLMSLLCMSIILPLLAYLLNQQSALMLFPVILSIGFIQLVISKYQVESKYHLISKIQLLQPTLRISVIALAVLSMREYVLFDIYLGYSIAAIVIVVILRKQLFALVQGKILSTYEMDESKSTVAHAKSAYKLAMPFGFATFFHFIYFQSDIVLIQYFRGSSEAGYYAVTFQILAAIYIIPGVVFQKYFAPKYHKWKSLGDKMFVRIFQVGNGYMLIVGLLMLLFLALWGGHILIFLFGEKYSISVDILLILMFGIPLRFLSASVGGSLTTGDLIIKKVKIMGAVALLNFILNILLIPRYGYYGACYATLFSEFILMLFFIKCARDNIFGKDTFSNWFNFRLMK